MTTISRFLLFTGLWLLAVPRQSQAQEEVRFSSISVGLMHACALDAAGRAYCWGLNDAGQLGAPTSETCSGSGHSAVPCNRRPVPVETDIRFVLIAAGESHTCALARDGTATYCWGSNALRSLGVATVAGRCLDGIPCSQTPVAVTDAPAFTRLAVGLHHSCGLTADGQIFCWGSNDMWELGSDSASTGCQVTVRGKTQGMICRSRPLPVSGSKRWVELAAVEQRTCALDRSGALYCWGEWLPLSPDPVRETAREPREVPAPARLHGLSLGGRMSVALTAAGLPVEWGYQMAGPSAKGSFPRYPANREWALREGPLFAAVTAGYRHRCGLTSGGEAYCWGDGPMGQLGTGKKGDIWLLPGGKWAPGKVAGGYAFRAISAGGGVTCGLTADGAGYCWGENSMGQLGIGSTDDGRSSPTAVATRVTVAARANPQRP